MTSGDGCLYWIAWALAAVLWAAAFAALMDIRKATKQINARLLDAVRLLGYIGILMTLSVGCVTLTPAGSRVLITSNPDTVRGCRLLGQVKGSDRMWGGSAGQGVAEDNATAELKNRAAEMGANVVFLSRSSTGFSGSSQLGEAYFCEQPRP